MPTLAEAMRAKADAANAPYTLAAVHEWIAQVASRGSYWAGFNTAQWTGDLTTLLTEAGFRVEDTGTGSTRVYWEASRG